MGQPTGSRHRCHLSIAGAATPAYVVYEYQHLVLRSGTVTTTDFVIGAIGILLILEATRRAVGKPMLIVVIAFLAYAFAGPYMPGILAHRGLTPQQLVSHLYYTTEGVFGIPLGVSSTFIFSSSCSARIWNRQGWGNSSLTWPMRLLDGLVADRRKLPSFPVASWVPFQVVPSPTSSEPVLLRFL